MQKKGQRFGRWATATVYFKEYGLGKMSLKNLFQEKKLIHVPENVLMKHGN